MSFQIVQLLEETLGQSEKAASPDWRLGSQGIVSYLPSTRTNHQYKPATKGYLMSGEPSIFAKTGR